LILRGRVPLALVREGLNTLLIQVVRAKDSTVEASTGFLHSGKVPTLDAAKPDTVDDQPVIATRPPRAVATSSKNLLYPLSRTRNLQAAKLTASLSPKPTGHLHSLALASPILAERLNIPQPPKQGKKGAIRLADKLSRGHDA
jgi:hypothetical protein